MSNILSLGCSWTYGHGLDASETYSAHLQKLTTEYTFINAGHCGADIDYAIFSGVKLIEQYNPEIVIFQVSSFDRITLGTDGFNNFLKNDYQISHESKLYYDRDRVNVRLIGINDGIKTKYTHGSYTASKKDRAIEIRDSATKQIDSKKYKNFVDVMFENIVHSEYETDKKINNLFLFKEYLKSKKIKSLWFFWVPSFNDEFFKSFFSQEVYIETPVIKWFKKTYPNKNFYIDNGYHISSEGNKILAEQYIYPRLIKIL